ncbi:hypothetical protein EWM64_g3952 [Hericium alpestre]|uniref:AMP-activated protein kinase glycogen-binding domain-containing protein n=1 Tax=Hericium alpestre TaxID=135208 RepID=A0A4Z0A0V1_9AGAM|nr:hypothetical protein EWM64_g3952 [Hericium alpestre]
MPSITTGLSLRLPSFALPSCASSYLCFQWSSSVRLSRTSSGFEAPVRIPWSDKIAFKFIVDGKWMTSDSAPTEADSSGFINNVYKAPPKPAPAAVETPPAPEAVREESKATEAESTTETAEPKQNGVTGAFSRAASAFHETFVAPAVEFASQMDSAYDVPTPSATEAPSDSATEAKKAVPSAAEKAQEAAAPVEKTAQVAPKVKEVEERSAEVNQPAPSAAPEPEPARVKPLSTTASALAPTAPINIVPILPQLPEVQIVAGSTVAPTAPAEPEPIEASTHTPSAVETAATGPPVVEVVPTGASAAPEIAPPILEASAGPPKEVAPADTTAVVETAAAPATEEVPVTAAVEEEGGGKKEAPEVLAAPPVAAEGGGTSRQNRSRGGCGVPSEDPAEPAKVEEPATNGTSEAKPVEPAPAAEAKPVNGTANGKRKSSSHHRRASSLISALGPKKDKQAFPAEDGASQTTPSRQGSQRKKRNSIFGKIKGIFHQEKRE